MADTLSQVKPQNISEVPMKLAETILQDPILLRRLNDRIYNIFLDELRQLRDRNPGGNA